MAKQEKPVTIIARYQVKATGQVFYKVRSCSSDAEYCVMVWRGHGIQCDCPAGKPCKHMKRCTQMEAQRNHIQHDESSTAQEDEKPSHSPQNAPCKGETSRSTDVPQHGGIFHSMTRKNTSSVESALSASFLMRGQRVGGYLASMGSR